MKIELAIGIEMGTWWMWIIRFTYSELEGSIEGAMGLII